ncbi:response regulator transcription factor [Falsigemmobacter intermedius]|uniref:Response regulator transcription factor n=1 Tax=Falsigemmobacter intermedius TaxID=1553448 RepID=A0A444MCP8_9RHOB|nr:response regulator transcription factor [Falsigemmobacter intermedius]RWY41774.1 response regulator transcription factor [Falsigemmobacter intermedius]
MTEVSPQILVVEDARDIRGPLCLYLRREGFRTLEAGSAEAARELLSGAQVHAVILDIKLPGDSGLVLCAELARAGGPPVILLTAMASDEDSIIGLNAGADDYVVKPFNPAALVARLRSLLRRVPPGVQGPTSRRRRFAGRLHDPDRQEVSLPDGTLRHLTSGENRLLSMFLDHPDEVLSRQRLIDRVRGRDLGAFDRTIDTMVSRLRRKIGDGAGAEGTRIIATEWGGGYRLCAEVETVE